MITWRTEAHVMGIVGLHVISHHTSPQQAERGKGDTGESGHEVRRLQKEGSEDGRRRPAELECWVLRDSTGWTGDGRCIRRLWSRQIGGCNWSGIGDCQHGDHTRSVREQVAKAGRWASRSQRLGSGACSLKSLGKGRPGMDENQPPGTTVLIRD